MMSDSNKRIAKNTMLLYIRMFFTLLISLYISRLILDILGAKDFGIFNVVGGVVILFSFLTNAMTSSTQRFLNYSIGLKVREKTLHVFRIAMLAHFSIACLVLAFSETIGLWLLLTQLNIPPERLGASVIVYQMSILITVFNILVIPYRASVIASEKMSIFAFLSMFEILLKLFIVLSLKFFIIDKLIGYSILLGFISIIIFLLYRIICRKTISFTHYRFIWDSKSFKEQISFSTWYLFGGLATVGAKEGTNILINIFFSVAINAAVGIANQVRAAIYGFVTSFQLAFNPRIVKLYASKEQEELHNLLFKASKFSFYLLFLLSAPIIIYCTPILSIWLVDVPKYTVTFTQLVIISSFFEALSAPLWTAIGATGKVRNYQCFVSLIILLDLPLVYFVFQLGCSPSYAFVINILINFLAYLFRVLFIRKYIHYSLFDYVRQVLCPCLLISILSVPILFFLKGNAASFPLIIIKLFFSFIIIMCIVYIFGLDTNEKNIVKYFLNSKFRKHTL